MRLKWPVRHWNLLRWAMQRHLGWPAALALGLLALTLYLALWALPDLQAEQSRMMRRKVAQLSLQLQRREAASRAGRDPRDEARDALPALSERGKVTGRLLDLLTRSGLTPGRVDYVVQAEPLQLSRLQVSLPVTGTYPQLRRFIGQVLNQLPYAALDSLQIDRQAVGFVVVDGMQTVQTVMHLSLYFRAEPGAATASAAASGPASGEGR
jgi:hypothetical protein